MPLVPLKAAAASFGDPHDVESREFEWVAIDSGKRLSLGMFVAQVIGKSMDPETGERYTIKRYESEKVAKGDTWELPA